MTTARIVIPPEVEPVTLEELRLQARVDHGKEDALLVAKIAAARRHIENLTRPTLAVATFEVRLDRFPSAAIELPKVPVVEVSSITYVGADGVEAVLSPADYVVDTASPRGWIVPRSGSSWPTTMRTLNAVGIRFTAGYAPEDVPEPLREAILQLAAWWYAQREAADLDPARPVPFSVGELVNEHRGWTF